VDKVVVLLGRLSAREDETAKMIVERVLALQTAWSELPRLMRLIFDGKHVEKTIATKVSQMLRTNVGSCAVYFGVRDSGLPALDFYSKTLKVRPNPDLVHNLREMLGAENVRLEVAMPPVRGREKSNGRNGLRPAAI
jgi:hypothetical protein